MIEGAHSAHLTRVFALRSFTYVQIAAQRPALATCLGCSLTVRGEDLSLRFLASLRHCKVVFAYLCELGWSVAAASLRLI